MQRTALAGRARTFFAAKPQRRRCAKASLPHNTPHYCFKHRNPSRSQPCKRRLCNCKALQHIDCSFPLLRALSRLSLLPRSLWRGGERRQKLTIADRAVVCWTQRAAGLVLFETHSAAPSPRLPPVRLWCVRQARAPECSTLLISASGLRSRTRAARAAAPCSSKQPWCA